MRHIVTRKRYDFAVVKADTEEEALVIAAKLSDENWMEDDRPDEFSIDCEPEEDGCCEKCALFGNCPGYYDGCYEAVNL